MLSTGAAAADGSRRCVMEPFQSAPTGGYCSRILSFCEEARICRAHNRKGAFSFVDFFRVSRLETALCEFLYYLFLFFVGLRQKILPLLGAEVGGQQ